MPENQNPAGVNIRDSHVFARDIVGRDKIEIHQAARPTFPALHQLPSPPRDFTGRDAELAELLAAIETNGVTISSLHGLGGAGKTTLALKLAERLAPRYPDAQFYLDLDGVGKRPLLPREAMEHVIRAYHPGVEIPESEASVAGLYQTVLHDQRALLLIDNVRDRRQVEPLIPPPSCLLLVTSRWHFVLPGLFPKNLEQLAPADARALLVRIAPRLGREGQDRVAELAQLCGYLPQALRSVASVLAARADLTLGDYVRKLADTQQRLRLTESDAALELSYGLLSEELQRVLRQLAVFPASFEPEGAADVLQVTPDAARDALGELAAFSLVEYNEPTARYGLHDLVHAFGDSRLAADERYAAQKRHAAHFVEVLAATNRLFLEGGDGVNRGLELFDVEWANIRAGQSWAAAHAHQDEVAARLCDRYPGLGISCLTLRLHPRELIHWLELALSAAHGASDGEADGRAGLNVGGLYEALGGAYEGLAEYRRAIECYEKSRAEARRAGEARVEGRATLGLGAAHACLGDYRSAIDFFKQALQLCAQADDRRGQNTALSGLAGCSRELGDHQAALGYSEQHLKSAREMADLRGEGLALAGLARACGLLGERERAIEHAEESLRIARKIGDRRTEGVALNSLGRAYASMGDDRRAAGLYEQQLSVALETGDRRSEGIARWDLGQSWHRLGERAQCLAQGEAALQIYEQIEHPEAATVREQIALWRGEG